jgi:hypothetical protein
MNEQQSLVPGILLACLAAGPAFVLFSMLGQLIAVPAEPIAVALEDAAEILPLAFLFGGLSAIVPVTLGAVIMRATADDNEPARRPAAWALAGALPGALIALPALMTSNAPVTFEALLITGLSTIATAALCALICRSTLRWD